MRAQARKKTVTRHLSPVRAKQRKTFYEALGFTLVGYGFVDRFLVFHWEAETEWNTGVHPWP